MEIERIKVKGKEIVLVGTAHISKESVKLVEETIKKERPDCVGVELDAERFEQLKRGRKWKEMDILKAVKEGKAYLLLLNLMLANMQRRFGEKVGVMPGAEMLKAIKAAKEAKVPVVLLDRAVKVTLKRAMHKMGILEKLKLLFGVAFSLFSGEKGKITAKQIEEMKRQDVINRLLKELSGQMPSVKEVLVDERDIYIANKILASEGGKIVAIVGAGHLEGIKKYLDRKRDISALNVIPKGRNYFAYLKFLVPIIFFAILAIGFYLKGVEAIANILLFWIFINGSLSAIGAALARAHVKNIAVAFLAAPFTSLHPAFAAGWFAGLVEAKICMPKIKDFEGLNKLNSYSDFNKNRVTHILLVTAYANLGSTIGTVVALPYVLTLLG